LNNDLSEGVPDVLKNLTQAVAPPLQLGWYQRRKTVHFEHYNQVANEFAKLTGMDPWLINPIFASCDHVNFLKREGEKELMHAVDTVLRATKEKYQAFGIKERPFVVVKADSGTYGMGVMMVSDAQEILHLNRKERTRMTASKGHRKITEVIVQEGVYSFETVGTANAVAEPVVYMFGQHVMGGFYRVHTERSNSENLNAPGAYFKPLAFSDSCNNPDHCLQPDHYLNRYYAYGVVARLALVAAAREMSDLKKETA
jgi:glutamate--cysteine ligase